MAKPAARLRKPLRGGCEVLRPSKAAAEVLRLLRPAQNVPHSSFEAQEKQLVGPREVPWPSKRHAFESCCGGLWGSKAFESCCGGFEAFEACPKTCHIAVSKAKRNSLWGLVRYHGQASGTPSKAAAEGCDVLRPSKAAAEVLRLLRPAQNVPHSSFEAQ